MLLSDLLRTRLLPALLRALASTWRFRVRGELPDPPAVIAFWHGGMLPVWKFFAASGRKNARLHGVTSLSRDGDILASLLRSWGYELIRGSSSKGGGEVLDGMVAAAKQGFVLVTPDGPRGPAHEMKPGAPVTAFRAQVPLVLCAVSVSRKKVLERAWDKFQVPMPFAAVTLSFSSAIHIPPDSSRDMIGELIERSGSMLNRMEEEC